MLGGREKTIEVVPLPIDFSNAKPMVMQVTYEGILELGLKFR